MLHNLPSIPLLKGIYFHVSIATIHEGFAFQFIDPASIIYDKFGNLGEVHLNDSTGAIISSFAKLRAFPACKDSKRANSGILASIKSAILRSNARRCCYYYFLDKGDATFENVDHGPSKAARAAATAASTSFSPAISSSIVSSTTTLEMITIGDEFFGYWRVHLYLFLCSTVNVLVVDEVLENEIRHACFLDRIG